MLEACRMVFKLKRPDATDIIGIATEPGFDAGGRSEDAIYMDTRNWNSDHYFAAKRLADELKIFVEVKEFRVHEDEYPVE